MITLKGGHAGGLELWNAHRCAARKSTFPQDFPETPAGKNHIRSELKRLKTVSDRKPLGKCKFHHIDLLENSEKSIPGPPGVNFSTSGTLKRAHLLCIGRGRIEKFALVAKMPSDWSESNESEFDVLFERKPLEGNFDAIGYATSVSMSIADGSNVAIAAIDSVYNIIENEKVIYKNLHWKHWRKGLIIINNNNNRLNSFNNVQNKTENSK